MNWKKALGFGVLVWIIMFVVISILVAYQIVPAGGEPMVASLAMMVLSLVLVYLFVRLYVAPKSAKEAIWYGVVFAVVGIILDFVISQRFAPGMFASVVYWLSYLLMIFVPILAVKKMPVVEPAPQQ